MTPRQLRGLAEAHREISGGGGERAPAAEPVPTRGSAGWLLAVAQNLDQRRPGAPGVG